MKSIQDRRNQIALRRANPTPTAPATVPQLANNSGFLANIGNWSDLSQVLQAASVPTEGAVLGLPAAWRCLNLISNAVSLMLCGANVYDGTGTEVTKPSVIERPNNLYRSYEFWYEAVATILLHGNWVAIKTAYIGDFPTQLVPVHPCNVECRIGTDGYPIYRIGQSYYAWNDVVHIRGLTLPGEWWGLGVIEAHRRSLTASVDMQTYASSTYRTGAVPTAAIQLAGRNVQQATLEQVAENWQQAYGSGQRKPVVLPEGMTVTPLAWSPEDSQFLQSRMLNIAEHAFMWGLSPSDLDTSVNGSANTYANIEQRNIERITSSYAPWLYRFEQAFSDLLPGDVYVRGNVEALLRTDTMTRYQTYRIANPTATILTEDEIRALENRKPLPPQANTGAAA